MRVNKHRLSLGSTFRAKGYWWLPGSPESRLAGTVGYSPEGLSLELHGALSSTSLGELGTLRDDFDRFPMVHGTTDAGPCTLINAFLTGARHNLAETTDSTYSAIYLLLGGHIHDESMPAASVSFSCSHLDDFLGPASFSIEDDEDGEVFRGTTVRYVVPKPLVLDLPSESARLEFEQSLLQSLRGQMKISLTARHTITIIPTMPQPVRWFIERIWRMCHLLSLLSDEIVRPERIEVLASPDSDPLLMFYKASGAITEERRPASLLLFYCAHVVDQLGDILNRWFSASPTLTSAIHLFMDGQRQHGSLEGRFLTLTQAFEAVSRATVSADYMAPAEYEKVKSRIIAAIPAEVASDHRASLKSRINYGNEYSLRKRLTQAVESLPPEAIECICKSTSAFVAGVVETRNYLTHYSDDLRVKALRGADLSWACERVAMLLRILLLRELGLDMALIVRQVKEHPRLLQYRQLYHSHREKA